MTAKKEVGVVVVPVGTAKVVPLQRRRIAGSAISRALSRKDQRMTKENPKGRQASKRRTDKAVAPVSPSVAGERKDNVVSCVAPQPDELNTDKADLKHLGGGKSDLWNNHLINQTINTAFFPRDITQTAKDQQCCGILGFMAGVNPADVIEGMVAAQLYASHASAMECYRRAWVPETPLGTRETLLTLAAKLTKANAAQVEGAQEAPR